MKKGIVIISILLANLSGIIAQTVKDNGNLRVEGTFLVNEKSEPVVLRGMSFGWHNWWPRFYNSETVKWLKDDWKCTVVRAAMGVGPDSGYTKKPEWSYKLMKNVIEAAIKEDIYVLVDWHSHGIYTEEAVEFFTKIASEYGEYPNIIYEIYNEPVRQSWSEVKNYSVEVIKAIRAIDPDNVILVGSPHWDQDIHIVADDPITGYENLMYTVHFYAATHKKWLRERCDYALEKNIPIFVSECAGMKANGDGDLDYKEWQKWIDYMEKNKISWITWSIADKNETCSVLYPSAGSKGKWKDTDIKESGLKTREYLRSLNK